MTTESISWGGDPQPQNVLPETPPSTRNRRSAVIAVVAILAVVGAGIGIVVSRNGAGSSPQLAAAEKLVPSTAFAVGVLDLSNTTALDHALAIANLFPDSPTVHTTGDSRTRLLDAMLSKTHDPHVTASDVDSWLGDVAVVDGYLDSSGTPQAQILISETDEAKAKAFFTKISRNDPSSDSGYSTFKDGYLVVGASQATVTGALSQATAHSLAGNATYHSDLTALPSGAVMYGWADGGALLKLAATAPALHDLESRAPQFSTLFSQATAQVGKARAVLGLRVGSKAAHLDLRVLGVASPSGHTVASNELRHLPSGTNAALAIASIGSQNLSLLRDEPGFAQGQVAIKDVTGLTLPDDLITLAGNGLTVSVGKVLGGTPDVALTVRPTDVSKASTLVDGVLSRFRSRLPFPLGVKKGSDRIVVATSDALAAQVLAGTGALGSQPGFGAALDGIPAQVSAAFYVNLGAYLPLAPHLPPDLTHLAGFGFWTAPSGAEFTLTFQ